MALIPRVRLRKAMWRTVSGVALILLLVFWFLPARLSFPKGVIHGYGTIGADSPSRTLVVASLQRERTRWVKEELTDHSLQSIVYVVDNASAEYRVPRNKGHEAMAYLTYIVDHYDTLPDVSIFTHADRFASHNEELLDNDMVQMLHRLKYDRIVQDGYFNLRCNWDHGCPSWLDLSDTNSSNAESTTMQSTWNELHSEPMPESLAQPCCGQFAASKARIQSVPRERWLHYRDWLLTTNLSDYTSGRVWEYTWQYVLSGKSVFCPTMSECYCEGYGICFGSDHKFQQWWSSWVESKEWFRQYLRNKAMGYDDPVLMEKMEARKEDLKTALNAAMAYGDSL